MKTENATSTSIDRIIVELPDEGEKVKTDVTPWIELLKFIGPEDLRESLNNIRNEFIDYYITALENEIQNPEGPDGIRTMAQAQIFHLRLLIDYLAQVKPVE